MERKKRCQGGGHCLLAWPKVTRSLNLGGLGISNLQNLGWALKLRWLWLQKTEPDKAWVFSPSKLILKSKHSLLWLLTQ